MAGCPKMSVTSPCMSLHAMLRRITWSRHNAGVWSGRRVTFRKDDADDVATLTGAGGVMNPRRQAISILSAGQLCQTHPVRLQLSSRFPKTIVEPSFSDAVLHAQTGVSKNVEPRPFPLPLCFCSARLCGTEDGRAASKGDANTHHLPDLLVVLIEAGKPQ